MNANWRIGAANMNDAEIESVMQSAVRELQQRTTNAYTAIASGYTLTGNISPLFALGRASEYVASRNADLKSVDYFIGIAPWLIDCAMGRKPWPEDSTTVNRAGALEAFKSGLQAAHDQLDSVYGKLEIVPGLQKVQDISFGVVSTVAQNTVSGATAVLSGASNSIPWLTVALVAFAVIFVIVAVRPRAS